MQGRGAQLCIHCRRLFAEEEVHGWDFELKLYQQTIWVSVLTGKALIVYSVSTCIVGNTFIHINNCVSCEDGTTKVQNLEIQILGVCQEVHKSNLICQNTWNTKENYTGWCKKRLLKSKR